MSATKVTRSLATIAVLLAGAMSWAEDGRSPVGRWKTIDDSTKQAKSIVSIWELGDTMNGNVETIFPEPGKPADPICDKCQGAYKNKPIKGMTILWGLKKDGSEWSGGWILDPENGKTYKCYVEVVDGGRRLKVRGYMGVSILGRTQYWDRVP